MKLNSGEALVKLFPFKYRISRDLNSPKELDICPVRLLKEKFIILSLEEFEIESGILPLKLFPVM